MIEPSQQLQKIFDDSIEIAKKFKHKLITIEHLTFAIFSDKDSYEGLKAYGADVEYIGEENGIHPGNFQARYVSKRVRLQQGVESRDIRVILTAAIPPEANIHVFAKVRSAADDQPFKEKKWQLLRRPKLDAIQIAGEPADTTEFVFRGTGDDDTYPFAYTSSPDGVNAAAGEGDRYMTFNEFAIKIVMQTSDSRFVPVIHDMRAIAVE